MPRRTLTGGVLPAAATLLLVACAPGGAGSPHPPSSAVAALPLTQAIRAGHDDGPIPGAAPLSLSLVLERRHAGELAALIAAGGHVTPSQLAARYSPDPGAVAAAVATLRAAGLRAEWGAGSAQLVVTGPAGAAERLFKVDVHRFTAPNGQRFQAPLGPVTVPSALRPAVAAVLGFTTYPATRYSSLVHGELSPSDVESIYDIGPLHQRGLDGSGLTVAFPEGSIPQSSVLDSYASKFGLPAFDVTVKTDPSWGPAARPGDQGFDQSDGETEMDLEIVHAIAPGAKEVVYAGAGGGVQQLPLLYAAIAQDFPNAIVSSSLGLNDCEGSQYQQEETAFDSAWSTMAGEGTTAYDASGDFGAFCEPGKLGVYPDVASPNVTAVGATTVFQAADGGYAAESAWGDPVDQIGTGGGLSTVFHRPSWQAGPGVQNKDSNGMRQVPDAAAPGDPISPYDTIANSGPSPGNGTSAAAPFWAAITALIYQALAQQHLGHPGLMAPVLYALAQSPAGLPSNPFHDVQTGSNLNYAAGPGWDYASGWGTPDVARLADDLVWYETNHPQGTP
ncbi:MAG: S8 family serine peptidase [Candidatus Dormibacteraeota bacterium]|nr:S8 family serine peptidase [Candidatus Dormibacteraeota bacterium]MBV9526176.1 S8 family serine peptidase [Candidatus Dormibacteraeota bacterium]